MTFDKNAHHDQTARRLNRAVLRFVLRIQRALPMVDVHVFFCLLKEQMSTSAETLKKAADMLDTDQSKAFAAAFRERQTLCNMHSSKEGCNGRSDQQCCWSDDKNQCVGGSIMMCEKLSESKCAASRDCRWYAPDSLCVIPSVHDVMSKSFQQTTTAEPLNK